MQKFGKWHMVNQIQSDPDLVCFFLFFSIDRKKIAASISTVLRKLCLRVSRLRHSGTERLIMDR